MIKLLYDNVIIDKDSVIEKNCKIVCVDGGKLTMNHCYISSGTYIIADNGSFINIQNAFIGRNCVIAAKKGITIESGVAIAEMVVIRDQNHIIDPNNPTDNFSNYSVMPIHISSNAWIASKSTILKGVTIGNNAIVAASAVVTKSVPSNEVWGGVPAKFIKSISKVY